MRVIVSSVSLSVFMKLCNNRIIAKSWSCFLLFTHLLWDIMELWTCVYERGLKSQTCGCDAAAAMLPSCTGTETNL